MLQSKAANELMISWRRRFNEDLSHENWYDSHMHERNTGMYFVVDNDSMQDVGIYKDDLILANTNYPLNGQIVLASISGETIVRKYFKTDQGEFLMPENVEYSTIEVGSDHIKIQGVVTKVISSHSK